ncbi:hypothetical protein PV328_010876 [Microctonus aethiopoides]|uniref:Centrosomal protein of 78 kDa n=1 Tax=Microctonus aethiopoides TaxID=144406 RepID=A0AA39FIR7_9HYME|nr:hypothetical protein PV328_010876 [Microctonus aethiopoides]
MTTANIHEFATCYIGLCKQQRLRPLPIICATLPHSLDFMTDRVKTDDWSPILNSLSLDRSLKSVSVRSRNKYRKSLDNINLMDKTQKLGKSPAVLTRCLLEWLSHSVAQCVKNSSALTCLQLEGIPLPADCLAALCVGLSGTETLQHLSLRRCYIGDDCCAMICKTIADIQSIKSLNLSQCDLSSNSGEALASALCRQKLLLYHDTWKDSLRYREPNFQTMGGLRRLTLNGNPNFGNLGVVQIINAIQDSLWLKAFDIQNCGLTDSIGNKILELLDHNKTLQVVDVRLNSNLSDNIVHDICKRLEINNIGCQLEYTFFNLTKKDPKIVSKEVNKRQHINCNYINRPKSAIIRNSKTLTHHESSSSPSKNLVNKSTKTQLSLPSATLEQESNDKISMAENKTSKASFHLDLQSKILSSTGNSLKTLRRSQINKSYNNVCQTDKKINSTIMMKKTTTKFENILQQLSEAKVEREKLLMTTQSMKYELQEERARREADETKLLLMQQNLIDLENLLKTKESKSHGYLLINHESLNEISITFEQLLKMLDDLSRKSTQTYRADEEKLRSDIRQRIHSLIQKTKSEKLCRNINNTQLTMRFSKSENHMKNLSSVISPISHFEKNIGDHSDTAPITRPENNSCLKHEKLNPTIFSPCERARAIFAQIINGDIILNLDSHIS